jgi:molybdopterin synthase sulfur carrier subunit
MTVKVLFFARLREKMGMKEIDFALDKPVTLEMFQTLLIEEYPIFADLPQPIVIAINQQFAHSEQVVSDGDEVAFFPPVTGG